MKKIIISSICGALALLMVGCGSNASPQTLKDLDMQVARMQSTVNKISSSAVYDVTPSNYLYTQPLSNENSQEGRLRALMTESQAAFAEHEALRQEISSRSATLKSTISDKYKLSSSKIKALKTLTSTISGYSTDISATSHPVKYATDYIKKYKSQQSLNGDNLNVGYTQLNNELEKRITYFENVLSTFDQVENILNSAREDSKKEDSKPLTNQNSQNQTFQNQNTQNQTSQDNQNLDDSNCVNNTYIRKSRRMRNIDTYVTNPANGLNNNCTNGVNGYPNTYNYGVNNGFGYGNGYGFPFGVSNGRGFNGFYNRAYSPFNPGRNTDTYLPLRRNIDTYRPIVNNPEIAEEGETATVLSVDNENEAKNIITKDKKKPGHIIAKTQEIK